MTNLSQKRVQDIMDTPEILPLMSKAIGDPQIEMEFIGGSLDKDGPLTKPQFMRLLSSLRSLYPLASSGTTIDIQRQQTQMGSKNGTNPIRITIEGVEDIQRYCKTNDLSSLGNVSFLEKSIYRDEKNPSLSFRYVHKDYGYRVNLKTEVPLVRGASEVEALLSDFSQSLKYYRYKKRFSFLTNDRLFRIDLTAVKASQGATKFSRSFRDSKVLQMREGYELEIEYVGSQEELATNGILPIDDFLNAHVASDGSVSDTLIPYQKKHGLNVFSDLSFVEPEMPVVEPVKETECEYPELIPTYFPPVSHAITSDPMTDIRYDYWVGSDQEWIPDAILNLDKELVFVKIQENITADYKDAPESETYAEYMVSPPFTEGEQKIYSDIQAEIFVWPSSYTGRVFVPLSEIQGTSESQMEPVSFAPNKPSKDKKPKKKRKTKKQKQEEKDSVILMEAKMNEQEGNRQMKSVVTKVLETFASHIYTVLAIKQDVTYLTSLSQSASVLAEYAEVTEQTKKHHNPKYQKVSFFGPDPVTLSLKEMNPENPHSIGKNFVVTDKADGIRASLFIGSDKRGYLIKGKSMAVEDTGIRFENVHGSWLLDGEYITQDNSGSPIQVFAIFDVYFADEGSEHQLYPEHAYRYPWLSATPGDGATRSRILSDFKSAFKPEPFYEGDTPMTISFKVYEEPAKLSKKNKDNYKELAQMMNACKTVLKKGQGPVGMGYRTDGLIFLPMYCPVKSMNDTPVTYIGGRWDLNYKWKPPEENTIDFKVRVAKDTYKGKQVERITSTTIDGQLHQCKQVELYVRYSERDDPLCDFAWKAMMEERNFKSSDIYFKPPALTDGLSDILYLSDIPLVNGKLLCERDKTEIKDNMIVEMQYLGDNPEGTRWRPLRDRPDKDSPQYFTVANNVWDTIQNPVTKEMVTGKDTKTLKGIFTPPTTAQATLAQVQAQAQVQDDYKYYVGGDDPVESDAPLRRFHNYLKSRLIGDVASSLYKTHKSIAILDTSVGRGGDLKKYLGLKRMGLGDISLFLGLDISPDVGEAAKRFYNEKMRKPMAMFIQYDTSKPIHTGEGCVGSETEVTKNKHLIDILYKNKKSYPEKYRNIASKYRGLGDKGFDLISSQFTIHYYFKDELTLRGYLQNISDCCKKGGYFIGTCYDGTKVYEMLKVKEENSEGDAMLKMNDEFGHKVYSITKTYDIDDFTYQKGDTKNMFGQTIDVYMNSIGQTIQEYLVNFEMFADMMKDYGFELATPALSGKHSGVFDSKDFTYQQGLGGFDQVIGGLAELSSKDMALKGHYSEALEMLKDENLGLRELSVLNNWFIFKKV